MWCDPKLTKAINSEIYYTPEEYSYIDGKKANVRNSFEEQLETLEVKRQWALTLPYGCVRSEYLGRIRRVMYSLKEEIAVRDRPRPPK